MAVSAEAPDTGWYQDGDIWYYYYDGQPIKDTVIQIGDQYYGFDYDGWMYEDTSFYWDGNYYRAKEDGTLYVNSWAEPWYGALFYYGAEGKAVQDFQQIEGTWYYFDYEGQMRQDDVVWSDDYQAYYVLSQDGKAHSKIANTAGWQRHFGSWYLVIGNADEGFHPVWGEIRTVAGIKYAFEWDGKMVSDGISDSWLYDETVGTSIRVIADEDGHLVQNGWYQSSEGNWYYAKNYAAICDNGPQQLEGKQFFFNYDGTLAINEWVGWWDEDTDNYISARTNSNGEIIKSGWYQVDGTWYYANNYERVEGGAYNIGGSWFLFNWNGELYDEPGMVYYDNTRYYVTNTNGNLLVNQWKQIKTEDAWYFFGKDGAGLHGLQTINGKYYFFYSGRMYTETVQETDSGVYVFDKDGVGKKVTGWFESPYEEGQWMFADGNYYVQDEIRTIGGIKYAFDWDGSMVSNGIYWDYQAGAYYLFGANGRQITATGWQQAGGSWYLVQADGTLARGWKAVAGKWYYFEPEMVHDTMRYSSEDNAWFAFNKNGVATKLTGTGWKYVSWGRIYLKNGVPVQDKWEYIDGAWYYFYYDGEPYNNDTYEIDGAIYGFDANGKMLSGGWYGDCFFYGSGKAATGITTINGVKYAFTSYGYLEGTGIVSEDGVSYYVVDGVVQATVTKGWNFIGGKWYYAFEDEDDWYSADYYLATDRAYINDKWYIFNDDGVLQTNCLYYVWGDWFLTDAEGCPKTGWQYFGGKWYYADPDSSGWLYNGVNWVYENGADTQYVFKNCALQIGTFTYNNYVYTTDSSGKVIKETPLPDGWTYDADEANYIYTKNGMDYTGWVGEYYVWYGQMQFNEAVSYDDAYYYLGKDGRYVRGGWYQLPYGEWIYAKADGKLYCNEWLYSNGSWYYFDNIYMVCYRTYIDGELNDFDDDGRWLGVISEDDGDMPVKADGWQLIGGKWYYYHAGDPISGRAYIDGAWYCFGGANAHSYAEAYDESLRYMITNDIDSSWGYEYEKCFYYGANGKRAAYTGWKLIGNYWYFFNADYSLAYGLQKINGAWYYFEPTGIYDETTGMALPMNGAPAMVKNQGVVIANELYLFGADGSCKAPTTKNGWHYFGGAWYYVRNGKAVSGETVVIDGKRYSFWYDGQMATNTVEDVYVDGVYKYFYVGADGAQVTKSGWYKIQWGDETRWIFVGADGYLYRNGIYRIGGKDYCFYSYYLVE